MNKNHISFEVLTTLGVAQVNDNPNMNHIVNIAAVSMAFNHVFTCMVNFDEHGIMEPNDFKTALKDEVKCMMKSYIKLFKQYDVDEYIVEEYFESPIYELLI